MTSPFGAAHNAIIINSMLTPRSLSVGIELFAAAALVVWIATGCVLVAIYGAAP
jgi:hypothetical protein